MIEFLATYWQLISFGIATLLAVDRWRTARELKEVALRHQQEVYELKQENLRLLAAQKQDSDYNKLLTEVSSLSKEMRLLRDTASERHGEIQGKIGTMELELKVFAAKYTVQIDELYRCLGGRRVDDVKTTM